MNWTRHGEFGMVCEPYRLGWFDSFEECQIAAERHAEANK